MKSNEKNHNTNVMNQSINNVTDSSQTCKQMLMMPIWNLFSKCVTTVVYALKKSIN